MKKKGLDNLGALAVQSLREVVDQARETPHVPRPQVMNRYAGALNWRAARSFVVLRAGRQTVDNRHEPLTINADGEFFEASLRSAYVKIGSRLIEWRQQPLVDVGGGGSAPAVCAAALILRNGS